jgi:hypothetical protein
MTLPSSLFAIVKNISSIYCFALFPSAAGSFVDGDTAKTFEC